MSISLNNQLNLLHDGESEELINSLHSWGVHYLIGGSQANVNKKATDQIPAIDLIKRLAQCESPRVRDASISLFLLHPELADAVLEAYEISETPAAEQIAVLILATLYLQHLWSFRLALAIGHAPVFPEQLFAHLWQSRHLPSPRCQHGRAGLEVLQARERQRRGLPLNFIGDWQNQVDHLLLQEEAKRKPATTATGLLAMQDEDEQQECREMSMRQNVTRIDIDKFLTALGKAYRKAGRLYLAGGAGLVHMGLRAGSTLDIDIVIEASDEDEMITVIRRLVDQMQINIEFASPADFIPIPAQWSAHSKYIGRYGKIDAFYFDLYSLALSKISRGNDRDLIDVKLLVQQKLISLDELDAAFNEVLPRMGRRPYINLNPQKFAEWYAVVRQQLQDLLSK
ncbi:MAG: hypothetical protein NVSMB27_47930 [Ktedonobacteraceae bacterium]